MFGYVTADAASLTPEQEQRYRSVYCGLCRCIGQRHGQSARLSLTYDMAFLVLLLGSLYEPEEKRGQGRCLPHPVHAREYTSSSVTEYAADLNVALTYYKCLDDWHDDKSVPRLAAAKALEGRMAEIRARWPRQCAAIEDNLNLLSRLEAEKSADLDGCCRCFGTLMGELFVWREDRWSDTLRQFGAHLGAFIYLMDAVLDKGEDDRRGRYNPVTVFEAENGGMDAFPVLTMLIGDAAGQFERLPLEQDLALLRNILYSGVWARYAQAQKSSPSKEEPNS